MTGKKQNYTGEIFHFAGKWEMPSHCGIMIRKIKDGTLIILTELYETNPGSSVTSMIESLAGEVVRKYAILAEKAIFIVRNPERSTRYNFFAETFYRARMEWTGDKFSRLEWEKLEDFQGMMDRWMKN